MLFYERLRTLCREHNTSVSNVAINYLGVSNGTASGWKKGASPNSDIVIKASEYFGVSADYLLGLCNSPIRNDDLTYEENEVLKMLRAAGPDEREPAIAAMRAVLNSLHAQKKAVAVSYHSSENESKNQGAV